MAEKLNIVTSAHHASSDFGSFHGRCVLTNEQRKRFSDFGSGETIPKGHNGDTFRWKIANLSRGLIDLNRPLDAEDIFPTHDFGKPEPNKIWKPKLEPTSSEREGLRKYYSKYHNWILERVREFNGSGLVIAWDNTANYVIGKDLTGDDVQMPAFILSNRGEEGSPNGVAEEPTTCIPSYLSEFRVELERELKKRSLPDEILYNTVFRGGYVAQHYNTKRNTFKQKSGLDVMYPVDSFQVDYNNSITHDQDTLDPIPGRITALRETVEATLYNVYANLRTHTVHVDV